MNMNNQIKYPVVEQFVSINGEGTKAGELAVFIRFKAVSYTHLDVYKRQQYSLR